MFEVIVCKLDNDGRIKERYDERQVERRYQALTIAYHYDSQINALSGKRAYGTCIIDHDFKKPALTQL